jgi:hypothetical protein
MPLDREQYTSSTPTSFPSISVDNGVIVGDTISTQNTTGKILYSGTGTTYIPVGISTVVANSVAYQATAPTNPSVGQIWVDSSSNNTNYDPNLIRRKTIVATGGQTAFTADLAFTDGYEQVFLNGLLLTRNTDYTTTNSIQVNLNVAAVVNDVIDILSVTNLNSVSGSTATTTTNTFTGAQTLTPSNAAITPLTINGAFNQTADLLDINNYSTNNLFKIDAYGRIIVGNTYAGQNQNYLTVQNTTATGMYPWEAATLAIRDSRSMSASVGGGIIFEGNYLNTLGSPAAFAGIKGTKFNTTSGDAKGFLDLWSRGGGGIRMYTSEQVVGSESASPAIQIGVAGDTYLKGYNPTVSFTMSAYNDTSKQQIIMADNEVTKFYSLAPGSGAFYFYNGIASNGTSGATENFRIIPGYAIVGGYGQDLGVGGTWGKFGSRTDAQDISAIKLYASSSTFYVPVLNMGVTRSNNTGFNYILAASSVTGTADTDYYVRGDGQVFTDGSTSMSSPADYAEYFEWADGNPNAEDRAGYSVSLTQGNMIKIAQSGEEVIGIISGNPAVVGDAAWNMWTGKYQKDEFNRYVRDENGDRVLNPDYDPDSEYVPREKRKEWSTVGLVGKLRMHKGQLTDSRWIKMKDISDTIEEWLVR